LVGWDFAVDLGFPYFPPHTALTLPIARIDHGGNFLGSPAEERTSIADAYNLPLFAKNQTVYLSFAQSMRRIWRLLIPE
jgi:hypothetical protein